MEADLWYSEYHADDVRFSIRVRRHLHSEKTAYQQIDFFESDTFGTFFTLDGLMMVTEKDESAYHDMITHVPFAVNPEIRRVLIIGGGDGGTAREVSRYPHVERIDMVEIDERVTRLCQQYLPVTAGALDRDPRIRLRFEDGVAFIHRAEDKSYDLILVDSTDPVGPGEGLFSRQFYMDCRRILSEDGILINQHESPYYPAYALQMRRAAARIREIFPITRVYDFHMPTYPSGHWLFGFASVTLDPVRDFKPERWSRFGLKTRYYHPGLHAASFALPAYVCDMLAPDDPNSPAEEPPHG